MTQQVKMGSVVSSRAGHDKGRTYIVYSVDGEFVNLVDGEYRPISQPKRKRLKHVVLTHADALDEETLGKMHDFEIKTYLKHNQNV